MSRIARNPVPVPDGVTVDLKGQDVKIKGPKGELSLRTHDSVSLALEDNPEKPGKKQVKVKKRTDNMDFHPHWGTTWSNIRNMIKGVHEGYSKILEIHGVGLRANTQGSNLVMQLGFSHDVVYPVPQGIKIAVDKQTVITVTGVDKEKVGQVAAEIRAYKPPEPYKAKGIRYQGEYILRKEGKKK